MIFGDCPHCDGSITNAMPDQTPALGEMECENCGETYWLYCSRIHDCVAVPPENFDKHFKFTDDGFFEVVEQP